MTDLATPAPADAAAASVSEQSTASDPAPKTVTPEQGEAAPESPATSEAEKTDGEDDKPKKPKVPFSERISQIHAQKKQAEAERLIALREVERLRNELDQIRAKPLDQMSFDEQEAARLRAVVKEERLSEMEATAAMQARTEQAYKAAAWQTKMEAAAERMPDFYEVVNRPDLPISKVAAEFIVDAEKGAEVTYFLGKNPREAQRIASLPPIQQIAELARIETRLQTAPQVRKVSNAPSPPPIVGGGSSPGSKDPAAMSMDEYVAARKAGKI